jgi:uncharacterized membrane protein
MTTKLIITARCCYALALVFFGIQQCMLGKLVAGRPLAWPAQMDGERLVAYVTGGCLILTGLLVMINSKYQQGLIVTGLLLLVGAALPNLFETIREASTGGLLTNTGKALTLGSGAFLVLSTFRYQASSRGVFPGERLRIGCRYCFGLFLLASGIQHFLFANFVQVLIPAWIPGALFWVYVSGVFLIGSGICLLIGWKLWIVGKVIAVVILAWVFLLHLPRAIGVPGDANEQTAAFEALAFSGLAYLLSEPQMANDRP